MMTAEEILKLRDLGEVSKVQFKERLLDKYDTSVIVGVDLDTFQQDSDTNPDIFDTDLDTFQQELDTQQTTPDTLMQDSGTNPDTLSTNLDTLQQDLDTQQI